jgi:hypothetical protein
MTYDPPLWIFWLLLSLGILLAGYLTYRDIRKKYKVAWEVYDHLVELLRELTQTNDSKSRSEIYRKIEYERGRLPDKKLDEIISLFIDAENEGIEFDFDPFDDDMQHNLSVTNQMMRNHIQSKYGDRELEVNPKWL